MSEVILQPGNVVLYKHQPARISQTQAKKIEIQTRDGKSHSVRPKDVLLLHSGPISALSALQPRSGDVESAWELLAGTTTNIEELAELIYDEFTPSSAWAAWELVEDGLLFKGLPHEIHVADEETVAKVTASRAAKAAEQQARSAFLSRIAQNQFAPEDEQYLQDVVALAYEKQDQSRVLRSLGKEELPQNAHAFLLDLGYWDEAKNPYPERFDIQLQQSSLALPDLADEERRDLTHLDSYAIDDANNKDPDDAVSWENGRLWVHIADVAALIPPNSPADLEARARGANLYLPEQVVTMLPGQSVATLGLGIQEISPALSFGIDTNANAEVINVEIVPSWVRVTRLSYDEVDLRIDEPAFAPLYDIAQRYEERRLSNGAVVINLPEIKIRLNEQNDGPQSIEIMQLPALRSRDLVREAMLITGEAVAHFAQENGLAIPYSTQPPPNPDHDYESSDPYSMSAMYALRRSMRPSQQRSTPAPHSGLGMDNYVQATSPLRRYLDLVVHQQLRAFLRGDPGMDEQTVLERVGAASSVIGNVRRAERMSIRHWSMVYLMRNPKWQGEGIIVEQRGNRSTVLLPEIAVETQVYGLQNLSLDSRVNLQVEGVNLPYLEASFRALK